MRFGISLPFLFRFFVKLASSPVDRFSDLDLPHLLEIPESWVHGLGLLFGSIHKISQRVKMGFGNSTDDLFRL
jgi:hypothetical protein